jgi:hypothetical protein
MAQAVIKLAFHHWKLHLYSRLVRVEFVVDSVIVGMVFLLVLLFIQSIFPRAFHMYMFFIYHKSYLASATDSCQFE